jgi:ribosomal protein S18 acetylase RimI-like enzyme
MATWRPLTKADIPSLMSIADTVHPGLPEDASVFTERVQLFPSGCLALIEKDVLVGYAISHPTRHNQPPALDSLLREIPADADTYYIHDVAVLPKCRGKGYANKGIETLIAMMEEKGFARFCLVSVYGTDKFWGKFGFKAAKLDEAMKEKLKGYGDDAVFLERENKAKA